MTVWVFGASYAHSYNLPEQWMSLVASDLNTDLKTYAIAGSSIEYIYDNFNKISNEVNDNDVIIITLSTVLKRWFFRDHPEHSGKPKPDKDPMNIKVIYDSSGYPDIDYAMEVYEDILRNIEVYPHYLLNFLYRLNFLAKQKNLHIIVLPSYLDTELIIDREGNNFPFINFSKGKLLEISLNEFAKEYLIKHDFSKTDLKVNHFIKSNHIIFAKKMIDNIRNNKPIDLTSGFIKHIITEQLLNDPEFIRYELFDNCICSSTG